MFYNIFLTLSNTSRVVARSLRSLASVLTYQFYYIVPRGTLQSL